MAFEIKIKDHGPYLVKGPLALVDPDGGRHDVPEGKTIALCRCGHSENKPFCDGTHSTAGFESCVKAETL